LGRGTPTCPAPLPPRRVALDSAKAASFTGAGSGSLRQAILDANALSGADTIDVQTGLTGTDRLHDQIFQ